MSRHRILDWITRKWLTESSSKTASVERAIRDAAKKRGQK